MLSGEDPQSAIDAPRLNALPDLVRLEPGFAAAVIDALEPPATRSPWPTSATRTSAGCRRWARSAVGPIPRPQRLLLG